MFVLYSQVTVLSVSNLENVMEQLKKLNILVIENIRFSLDCTQDKYDFFKIYPKNVRIAHKTSITSLRLKHTTLSLILLCCQSTATRPDLDNRDVTHRDVVRFSDLEKGRVPKGPLPADCDLITCWPSTFANQTNPEFYLSQGQEHGPSSSSSYFYSLAA